MPDDPALRVLEMRRQNPTQEPRTARTWPGRLAEEDGVGLQNHLARERAERAAERDAGLVLVKIDPETIGLTEFANRHELSLSAKDKKLQALKASIKANGQDTPVRIRAVAGGALPYELVEGHRRHAAIRELNREVEGGFQILARLDAKASDTKDLVLKMYRENAEREDLSAYETGRMFQSWLAAKLYPTQGALADDIKVSDSQVTRCLAIACLPDALLQAFGDPRSIAQRWADALVAALKQDSPAVLAVAAELAKMAPRLDAEAIHRRLVDAAAAGARKRRPGTREEQFKVKGKIVWTFAHKRGFVAAKFPKTLDPQIEAEVAAEVKKAVDRVMTQRFGTPK
jgi:ParB family transcriptional regulator, chromosome partitioning protein